MVEGNGRVTQLEKAIEELKRILADHIPAKELKAILEAFDARISENTAKVNLIEAKTMEEIAKIRNLLQTRLGSLEYEQKKATSTIAGVGVVVQQMNSKIDKLFGTETRVQSVNLPLYSVTDENK